MEEIKPLAGKPGGVPILVEHVGNNLTNRTRFIVLGYKSRNQTSMMFHLRLPKD